MAIKRKIYRLRQGDIIDIEEYHDGRYGAPGLPRQKKRELTKEEMQKVNAANKTRRCRHRLLTYFESEDYFATWTYRVEERPPDMQTALKHFQKAMRYVRREYKKRGTPVFWIRNIERGTRGAWHIHLVINRIADTAGILEEAWEHGGVYLAQIKNSTYYDEDFTKLASYLTKDENTEDERKDGTMAKPRIREANYNSSRNMPLPEPHVRKINRWKKEAKPWKGYYIARSYQGINPKTGYEYRRYTMIRLYRRI